MVSLESARPNLELLQITIHAVYTSASARLPKRLPKILFTFSPSPTLGGNQTLSHFTGADTHANINFKSLNLSLGRGNSTPSSAFEDKNPISHNSSAIRGYANRVALSLNIFTEIFCSFGGKHNLKLVLVKLHTCTYAVKKLVLFA